MIQTRNLDDGAVTADKIDFTTINAFKYSSSELDTGATWIDGRSIYKKTLTINSLESGENTIYHNITGISYVIKYEGFQAIANTTTLQIPAYASISQNSIGVWTTYTNRILITTSIPITTPIYITLYYVKTS